jgi:hypothetical protein
MGAGLGCAVDRTGAEGFRLETGTLAPLVCRRPYWARRNRRRADCCLDTQGFHVGSARAIVVDLHVALDCVETYEHGAVAVGLHVGVRC